MLLSEWQQTEILFSSKDSSRDFSWAPAANWATYREREWRSQTAC